MARRWLRLAALALLASPWAGCTEEDEGMPLDWQVPPVTEGAWYRPPATASWHWQLNGTVNEGYAVDVYDVDLFEADEALLSRLKAAGRKVVCYFSAGSSEDWRPDFEELDPGDLGEPLEGWAGERWLDLRSPQVHAFMRARLELAARKGCDGVEPDNVDGFANATGFELTATDQLAFNRFLANEAHQRGLAVGLKNDGAQAEDLVAYFDFELNEECHAFEECATLAPFIQARKPVFNAEYADDAAEATDRAASLCPAARDAKLRTLILPWDLDDSFRVSCD